MNLTFALYVFTPIITPLVDICSFIKVSKFKFNQNGIDLGSSLEDLQNSFDKGPKTRNIIATFEAIENGDFMHFLAVRPTGIE